MKKQKGFTLIEILIVVIILAVLAAMILPRFLSQTENAYIAEAQQVLGVLRRAQANAADLGITIGALGVGDTTDDAKMLPLGLKGVKDTNFSYECEAGGASCTAKSKRSGSNSIQMMEDGTYNCTGYTYVDASYHSKGCKPSA